VPAWVSISIGAVVVVLALVSRRRAGLGVDLNRRGRGSGACPWRMAHPAMACEALSGGQLAGFSGAGLPNQLDSPKTHSWPYLEPPHHHAKRAAVAAP
jgi:hypothetical protein